MHDGFSNHTLRAEGWTGKLLLSCAERDIPYECPPLSKKVLLNEKAMEDCGLFDFPKQSSEASCGRRKVLLEVDRHCGLQREA